LLLVLLFFNLIIPPGNLLILESSSSLKENEKNSTQTPIEHIIVISQGGRSFDNYFGTYPGANGFPNNISIPVNSLSNTVDFNNFTVYLDFRLNQSLSKGDQILVNKGGIGKENSGNNLNFGVILDKEEKIQAGFETKTGLDYFLTSKQKYNDTRWHSILVSYDGSLLTLYIDKVLISKKNTNAAIPDDNKIQIVRIGSNFLKSNSFFTGDIDNLKIWNRSLTENEVYSLFNNPEKSYGSLVDFDFSFEPNKIKSEPKNEFISFDGKSYLDIQITPDDHEIQHIKPFTLADKKTSQLKFDKSVFDISYNYGFMDGFINAQKTASSDKNETIVMGYYDDKIIGMYWILASYFVLTDNFFSPSPFNDLANNLYLYSADPNIYKKNVPKEGLININNTIFDLLEKNGLSWKIYVENYDPNLNYTKNDETSKRHLTLNPILGIPRFVENATLNSKIVDLKQYFKDLKGDLPTVSYIISSDSHESSSKDVTKGEEFATSLIIELMKSTYWKHSVFILTYSSSGGWYDHVIPPKEGDYEFGFRIPTMIISPYSKEGFVDSTLYDTASILKFIEYNYNLPALNSRDSSAINLLNAFDFNRERTDAGEIIRKLIENYESRTFQPKEMDKDENISLIFILYASILILIPSLYFSIRFFLEVKNK